MERAGPGGADGTFDWDAAFEAIVAPLRTPRHVQLARVAVSAVVTAGLIAVTWMLLLQMMAAQARGLAHPMR